MERLTSTQSRDGGVDGLSLGEIYFALLAHGASATLDSQQPGALPKFNDIQYIRQTIRRCHRRLRHRSPTAFERRSCPKRG
jgi:hypothetical protein